ncbi:TonB-dependent receptor [candidate division KSB1 bacterium]|nr:TonB-dependent receptor [candidate division KSB1 bacterium]
MRIYQMIPQFFRFWLIFVASSLSAATAGNITSNDSIRYAFKPLVVTGARDVLPRNNLAAAIQIIPHSLLTQTNVTTVMEAVSAFTPGVFTTQRGVMGFGVSSGAAGGVTIRGLGGSPNTQVLVLIDGRPDFMGIFGHPLPDAYPLDYVENIEVLRGAAAAIYGTNAMGGVINIITHEPVSPGWQTKISLSYGNFGTQAYLLQHGGRGHRGSYFVTANYRKSDGHRPNSQFESQSYAFKANFALTPHYQLRFFGSTTPYNFHNPGPVNQKPEFESGKIQRHTIDLTLQNKFNTTNGMVKIHGNFGAHDLSDGWHSRDRTVGMVAFQNFRLPLDFALTLGIDLKEYGGLGENKLASAFIQKTLGEKYVQEYAGYLTLQKIVFHQWIFDGVMRFEKNSVYGTKIIPRLGLVFQPSELTAWRAAIAKGFRSPTPRELYFFPAANILLQPEELWSYDLGFTRTMTSVLKFELDTYFIAAENLIRVNTAVIPNRTLNTGRLEYQGVEVAIEANPLAFLTLRLAYNYLDSETILPFSPNKFSGWVSYQWRNLRLHASLESVASLYTSADAASRLANYTVLGAGLQYQLGKHLACTVNLENLGDRAYEILKGYPMPGRTILGKMAYEF